MDLGQGHLGTVLHRTHRWVGGQRTMRHRYGWILPPKSTQGPFGARHPIVDARCMCFICECNSRPSFRILCFLNLLCIFPIHRSRCRGEAVRPLGLTRPTPSRKSVCADLWRAPLEMEEASIVKRSRFKESRLERRALLGLLVLVHDMGRRQIGFHEVLRVCRHTTTDTGVWGAT
jgi:hypothetical protein